MLPEIKSAYAEGRLMLLLGAGASFKSTDSSGVDLPMSEGLAEELAKEIGLPYEGEPLSTVYSALKSINSAKLHSYLRRRMTHTRPSDAINVLMSFVWPRIYTLNIDDCIEVSIRNSRIQKMDFFGRDSNLEEMDAIYKNIQLIKLNGSADKPEDGFIFSPQEYGENSNKMPVWYSELAQDYGNYTFVFIGSRLNEPLFQHAVAKMRSKLQRSPQRGYVITPSASAIEVHHLSSLNLQHIPGTLSDFANWLSREFPKKPTGWDLALAKRPELRNLGNAITENQKRALNSVTLVSPDALPRTIADNDFGSIREFYKGFKPNWQDIVDNVPADISIVEGFLDVVLKKSSKKKAVCIVGPAGSGKTTTLMCVAFRLSKSANHPVYFLREAVSDIKNILASLEEINSDKFYVFIDKIESMRTEVVEFISSNSAKNMCLVFSERINIWNRRVKEAFLPHTEYFFKVQKINKSDARKILSKIKQFGPWTRMEKIRTDKERIEEIYDKADRQLLIGLMEATTGLGFTQIIRNDFAKAGDESHKKFLVLIGLASIHRISINPSIVGRSLISLGIMQSVNSLAEDIEGIVVNNAGKLSVRHPVYVRELFEKIVVPDMIKDCLVALLKAYADYGTPVIKNVSKSDGIVFKSIINNRFVSKMMRNDEGRVRDIYGIFETTFHIDGLYWLQYGLSLRKFERHDEALEKFSTARSAFVSPQIEHAYAQQLMIIAREASSWEVAEPQLIEAIATLRNLISIGWDGDNYPIVSLAEGHIKIENRFHGLAKAKLLARTYANELSDAMKRNPNDRLSEALGNVMVFATNGIFKDSRYSDYDEEE